MIIRKAYKFRLKTNSEIEELFFQFAGCNRKVWNMALDRAMKDAFDKKQPGKRFPVWKKKFKCVDSFRYPQGFKLEGSRVFLPKIGWVRFHKSREIQGTPRNMTVSRSWKTNCPAPVKQALYDFANIGGYRND